MPIIDGAWVSPSSMIAALGLDTYNQEYGDGYNGPNKALSRRKEVKEMAVPVIEANEGFMFGCDPECFILEHEDGEHVSAEGLIPGTKIEPYSSSTGPFKSTAWRRSSTPTRRTTSRTGTGTSKPSSISLRRCSRTTMFSTSSRLSTSTGGLRRCTRQGQRTRLLAGLQRVDGGG
jgi:hypothetical protein